MGWEMNRSIITRFRGRRIVGKRKDMMLRDEERG